jgi:hypothetical protein
VDGKEKDSVYGLCVGMYTDFFSKRRKKYSPYTCPRLPSRCGGRGHITVETLHRVVGSKFMFVLVSRSIRCRPQQSRNSSHFWRVGLSWRWSGRGVFGWRSISDIHKAKTLCGHSLRECPPRNLAVRFSSTRHTKSHQTARCRLKVPQLHHVDNTLVHCFVF